MLGLRQETNPEWAQVAEQDFESLLADHAHCELKAAQNAISLVAKHGEEAPALIAPLTKLAQEELSHFHDVVSIMNNRDQALGHPEQDAYVGRLRTSLKQASQHRPSVPVLLDRLLLAAMIEARSCERFSILSVHLRDGAMRSFYRGLMKSEALHYRLFRGFAEQYFGSQETKTRWELLAQIEARVVNALPTTPLMHG